MRLSKLLLQTYREAPRDADVISQQLMMRAGMIHKVAAGIYDYLPLALRSIRKFELIVREELNRDGPGEPVRARSAGRPLRLSPSVARNDQRDRECDQPHAS
jgi:prolyl-tRNA synthetase